MFCPNCGRDNSAELKFCASCGTNLEAVSQALTGREEDVFTRLDTGLDQFIARYTERVFTEPKPGSGEHSVVRSWRLLGQAIVTSLIDIFLFILMWNILPVRFLLLLITSPFRVLSEKNRKDAAEKELYGARYIAPELQDAPAGRLLSDSVPSVTEETTTNLGARVISPRDTVPDTDKLEDE